MKIAFYTLGCKVNQNETGALEQLFAAGGFSLAEPGEAADVYVVNSCTVTSGGDKRAASGCAAPSASTRTPSPC